ncbi:MAG: response regulator [Planctomycetes bacterium]|nr:response regulator [Planctomycetota bacterium]
MESPGFDIAKAFQEVQYALFVTDPDHAILWTNRAWNARFPGARGGVGNKCHGAIKGRADPCPGCPSGEVFRTGLSNWGSTEGTNEPCDRKLLSFPLRDAGGRVSWVMNLLAGEGGFAPGEEKLHLTEQKFRSIIEHSPLWIVELDPSGTVLAVNRQAERESGFAAAEIQGHNIFELIPEEDRPHQMEMMARGLQGGHTAVTTRLRMKDGTVRTFLNNSSLILLPDQPRLFVFAVDVTDRVKAEDALRQQMRIEGTASQVSNLLAKATDHQAGFTEALEILGKSLDATRAYIYAFSAETRSARKEYEWTAPGSASRFPLGTTIAEGDIPEWARQLLAGETLVVRDGPELHAGMPAARDLMVLDGTLSSLVVPMMLRGEIFGFLAADETRKPRAWTETEERTMKLAAEIFSSFLLRRRAEEAERAAREAAEAADRAKTVFLASMSHEIRTPMAGVLGMLELALETDLSPEQREYLSLAKSSADSLLGLLGGILDLVKIESGKLDLDRRPFSLRALMEDTLGAPAIQAQEKGLEASLRVDPRIPSPVLGDPARLREVLSNLVDNAVKYTAQGEVALQAEFLDRAPDSVGVRFSVRDTGPGIPEPLRDEVFDFYKRGAVPPGMSTGFGIGLAICRKVVGILGGKIQVEGEAGRGSLFRFDLRFGLGPDSREERPRFSGAGKRVLAADAHAPCRESLRETLGAWGFRVEEAGSAEEVLAAARAARAVGSPFDVLLLDTAFVEGGVRSAAGFLRESDVPAGRVVWLLKGPARKRESRPWEAAGGLRLLKPIRARALEEAVGAALGLPGDSSRAETSGADAPEEYYRVLLVEDNPVNRKLIATLLRKRGWTVEEAVDGLRAVEAFAREPFDAVLMDIQMPGMDGFEATRRMRQAEGGRGRRTPVVAMTAHAMKGDRELCLEAGMDDYISKPFHTADLVRLVRTHARSARSPEAAPAPEASPIDAEDVRNRLGVDLPVILEMLEMLVRDAPAQHKAMERAFGAGDWTALASAAHRLKGAAGNLGARPVFKACQDLESAARRSEREAARGHLESVGRELARLVRAVGELKGK